MAPYDEEDFFLPVINWKPWLLPSGNLAGAV
jgi:hypothetical protein